MHHAVTLYVTVEDRDQGRRIGSELVEARLAACANVIDGLTSIFRWNDEVQEAGEALLIAKTRSNLVDAATTLITDIHSYDCACVVALPIVGGNGAFIDWIFEETRGD